MAFYIDLNRTHEDDENFIYYYYEFYIASEIIRNAKGKLRGVSKLVKGKIRINIKLGEVEIIDLAEGDTGMYVQRAALALIKHWREGEFPEKTCWAS